MIEIDTYVEALKTTWVRREMKSNHSWTSLFEERISKGICLWEMNGQSLVNFSNQIINPFWIEVLRAYANISNDINIDAENMNRDSLWYSNVTKYQTN